jgi:asparagine synthase (glutamine-hydrolysing)
MIHRGPDSAGLFESPDGQAVLVHRRLRIIDLAAGEQPFLSEDRSIALVFNGEIYNFRELRDDLKRKGHTFRTQSDTEVLLRMYEQHGRRMLPMLRGMFAFAVYDGRTHDLWLARDRLGKKPLYYTVVDGSFLFGSTLDALTSFTGFDRQIDHHSVDLFLSLGYIPSPATIYRQTRKLSAGHDLAIDREGAGEQRRYWSVSRSKLGGISREEAGEEFERIFHESVALRLISDVPLGCFLSGGLDSTAVATAAARESSDQLKTFSVRFPDEEFNEAPFARQVAANLGTCHSELPVDLDAVDTLPSLVEHYGEPFGDSSAVPTWRLSQVTRREVTVALNGDGGDESFAGYQWYETAARLNRLAASPWARPVVGLPASLLSRRFQKLTSLLRSSESERYARLRLLLDTRDRSRLYGEGLRHLRPTAVELLAGSYEATSGSALDKMLAVDQLTYLADDLLPKVDVASMAHSLEARSPLLDHTLVEFVASLPDEFKRAEGMSKVLLRDYVYRHHGRELFERPKQGFSMPLKNWLRADEPSLRERFLKLPALRRSGYVEMQAVDDMMQEHSDGRRDHQALLWNLLVLDGWLQRYA